MTSVNLLVRRPGRGQLPSGQGRPGGGDEGACRPREDAAESARVPGTVTGWLRADGDGAGRRRSPGGRPASSRQHAPSKSGGQPASAGRLAAGSGRAGSRGRTGGRCRTGSRLSHEVSSVQGRPVVSMYPLS